MRSLLACPCLAILFAVVAGTAHGPALELPSQCPPPPPATSVVVCQCNCNCPQQPAPPERPPIASTDALLSTTTTNEKVTESATTDGTNQWTTSDTTGTDTSNSSESTTTEQSPTNTSETTSDSGTPITSTVGDSNSFSTNAESITTRRPKTTTTTTTTTQSTRTSTTVGTTTATPHRCSSSDILFLLDDSKSVDKKLFMLEQEIVATIVRQLPIGWNESRVALTLFDKSPRHIWSFENTDQSPLNIQKNTADLNFTGKSDPDLPEALYKASKLFEKEPRSDNASCYSRVTVVLTNGTSDTASVESADELKSKGVAVFAISVGDNADREKLFNIADRVIAVRDYNELNLINGLVDDLCNLRPTICDGQL